MKTQALRLNLFITELCNQSCYYCDLPQCEQKGPQQSLIDQYLLPICNSQSFETFTLTGGEPGLVEKDILDLLFNNSQTLIKVNTNGLFITNGFFEKYYNKISEVGYHALIEPTGDLPLRIQDPKIIIYQPVTKQNFKLINDLLTKYPQCQFNLIPYIRKRIFVGDEKYFMTSEDLKELYHIIQNHANVTEGSHYRIQKLTELNETSMNLYRQVCQNANTRYVVNFVRGLIHRCPESITHSDSVPLNDQNFQKMLNLELFQPEKSIVDRACQDCYYFPTFTKKNIEVSINKCRKV